MPVLAKKNTYQYLTEKTNDTHPYDHIPPTYCLKVDKVYQLLWSILWCFINSKLKIFLVSQDGNHTESYNFTLLLHLNQSM